MNADELNKIINDHGKWLRNESEGQMADLQGANLQGADLRGADLQKVNLQGADLRGADLRGADLRWANLQKVNLQGADLRWVNLQGADLQRANLLNADLQITILDKRRIRKLSSAIYLAEQIFARKWDCAAIANEFNLYHIPGEEKALIAFAEDFSGGFCFVYHRKEIWWWNWVCPNPETVTILWKMENSE